MARGQVLSQSLRTLAGVIALFVGTLSCTGDQSKEHLAKAFRAETDGAFHQAINEYIKALSPRDAQATEIALFKLGFIHETHLKEYSKALSYYSQLVKRTTNKDTRLKTQIRMAAIYTEFIHDYSKAIETLTTLMNQFPDVKDIDQYQFQLATAYLKANKAQQARVEIMKLIKNYPNTPHRIRAELEYAKSFYTDNDYSLAESEIKSFLKKYPAESESSEAKFYLAHVYEEQDDLKGALTLYEDLLQAHPDRDLIQLKIERLRKRILTRKR